MPRPKKGAARKAPKSERPARAWYDPEKEVLWIDTPFNGEFVRMLKSVLPTPFRRWHQEECLWSVDLEFAPTILDVMVAFWPEINPDLPPFTPKN